MQTILAKIEQAPVKQLYLVFISLAVLIAAQMQYIQHGWINPDSVLYFESARLIALGDFKGAVAVFNWPLYSACIAVVHKVTLLSIHQSAQLLNMVFFAITTASFIKLISLLGGNKLTMATGALVLFSTNYIVGDVLEMLMRDEGFWAFYLTSLVFFIQFYQHQRYRDAFLWQVCAIVATLFRIEAITYLIFLPAILLFNTDYTWPQRIQQCIKVNFLNITLGICIVAVLAFSKDMSIANFGRLKEVFSTNLWHELTHNLASRAHIMANEVLGRYLDEFAIQGLIITFIFVMIVKTLSAAGFINVILATLTLKRRHILLKTKAVNVIYAVALISLVNMSLIITKVFVLSTRYVVGFAFIILLLASFYLAFLLTQIQQNTQKSTAKRWLTYALVLFVVLSALNNLRPKKDGYNYMQEATSWSQSVGITPASTFYNDSRLRHFAKAEFIGTWSNNLVKLENETNNHLLGNHQFLLIAHEKESSKETSLVFNNAIKFKLIKEFYNHDKSKLVSIYQRATP